MNAKHFTRLDGEELSCLLCGNASFSIFADHVIPTKLRQAPEDASRSSAQMHIKMCLQPYICENCGFVMWFYEGKQPRMKL